MPQSSTENQKFPLRLPPSKTGVKRLLPPKLLREMSEVNATGIRRVQQNKIKKILQKSVLKKAMPYLLAGGSTGMGFGIGLSDWLL